jgi:hypothetical protein
MSTRPLLEERVEHLEQAVARLEAMIARLAPAQLDHGVEAHAAPAVVAQVAQAVDAPAGPDAAEPPPAADAGGPRADFETRVGTYWLSRGGIVALITGVAFYITVHFGDFGAFARVFLGYSAAAALSALGLWLARRYRLFGELLFAGGLAVAYFVTYALHFVPTVRVIDSEGIALGLLAASVLAIVAAAQRLRSETVAGIAMFLGLHASILGATTVFSLAAASLLACGALYFVLQNRWVIVPISTLVAVYTTHAWWVHDTGGEPLAAGLGFLVLTSALFHAAVLVRPHALPARPSVAFSVLNAIGFVALGTWELRHEGTSVLVLFLLLTAACSGAAAWGAARKESEVLVQTFLCGTIVTGALAIYVWFSGTAFVVGLGALGAGALWLRRDAWSLRIVGFALLVVATGVAMFSSGIGPIVPGLLAVAFVAGLHFPRVTGAAGESKVKKGIDAAAAVGAGCALLRAVDTVVPSSLTTLAWTTAAVLIVAVGLVLRERALRLAGLGLLALSIARLFALDLRGLPVDQRILTFVLLGVFLLGLSFAYTRFRAGIGRWL